MSFIQITLQELTCLVKSSSLAVTLLGSPVTSLVRVFGSTGGETLSLQTKWHCFWVLSIHIDVIPTQFRRRISLPRWMPRKFPNRDCLEDESEQFLLLISYCWNKHSKLPANVSDPYLISPLPIDDCHRPSLTESWYFLLVREKNPLQAVAPTLDSSTILLICDWYSGYLPDLNSSWHCHIISTFH